MSLIPVFELGLWNAWILLLFYFLMYIVLGVFNRLRGQKGSSRPNTPPLNETEKKLDWTAVMFFLAFVVY